MFDEAVSGNRAGVGLKRGHAAAHKRSQPHVMADSDRGLQVDGVTEVEDVGAPLVQPVSCTGDKQTSVEHTCEHESHERSGTHASLFSN